MNFYLHRCIVFWIHIVNMLSVSVSVMLTAIKSINLISFRFLFDFRFFIDYWIFIFIPPFLWKENWSFAKIFISKYNNIFRYYIFLHFKKKFWDVYFGMGSNLFIMSRVGYDVIFISNRNKRFNAILDYLEYSL